MARGGRRGRRRTNIGTLAHVSANVVENELDSDGAECNGDDEGSNGDQNPVIEEPIPIEQERIPAQSPESRSSYAAMLDPNEGNPLKFIPLAEIDGVKVAKIDKKDVESEVNYWSKAVLCTVVGANPPMNVIEGFLRRVWKQYAIDKFVAVKKGIYLVRFEEENAKWEVIQKGILFFDNKPTIVKEWNEELDINVDELQTLPVWIRLPQLDLKYWGNDSLSKIGSVIGVPIKTDKVTMQKQFLNYARLMVEVPLKGPFPPFVDFLNDKGVLVRQEVQYEWKPVRCEVCRMYGHEEAECRRKVGERWEWRPKQKHVQETSNQPEERPRVDEQGFQEVTRRMAARRQEGERPGNTHSIHNQYMVLDSAHEQPEMADCSVEETPPNG